MVLQDNDKITLLEALDQLSFILSYRWFCKTCIFVIKIEQLVTVPTAVVLKFSLKNCNDVKGT